MVNGYIKLYYRPYLYSSRRVTVTYMRKPCIIGYYNYIFCISYTYKHTYIYIYIL